MLDLKITLKELRPNLSASSITTYDSILRNLHKKVYDKEPIDMKNFNNVKPILEELQKLPVNRRKTILSALTVLTDNKQYRDAMLDDIKEYNTEISKQKKTITQEENWLEPEELKRKFNLLKKNAELLYKKKIIKPNDLQEIQNFIILLLFSGEHFPPRRSKDYTDFRIGNIKKDKDNYLEKNEMVFNSYKTAKTYGQQRITIPTKVRTTLQKWFKINPTDYLLFDKNFEPLTAVKLNQRLNKIFDGKKISVNALRHTFLTEKYGDIGEDMEDMGSSINMATTYIKKD